MKPEIVVAKVEAITKAIDELIRADACAIHEFGSLQEKNEYICRAIDALSEGDETGPMLYGAKGYGKYGWVRGEQYSHSGQSTKRDNRIAAWVRTLVRRRDELLAQLPPTDEQLVKRLMKP